MSWPELFGFSIGGRAPVIVTSIDENSVAQKSGLQVGDQLIEIEHENVQQFGVDDVILCAKRALNYPPFLSVLSRIRTVEIKYHQNCGYGLQFKGQGPVYIHAVFKFSPAYELGIRAGDMLLEVNGVQVTYSTQQDVETLVATIQSVLQIVLIPRAVKLNKNEIVRKENQINKATFFYKIINYYLGGDIEKKVTLIRNLNNYTKDKNISKLAYCLNNLLEDDVQRRLVDYIRPYIPAGHWNKLDIVMKQENNHQKNHTWSKSTAASEISNLHKRAHTSLSISTGNQLLRNVRNNNKSRVVQIQRNIDSGSLGVILQNNKPVIIHSVNTGGPADVAGLKKGDLILEINGQDVRNHCYPHVIELLKNSGSFPRLLVRSGGNINLKSVNNINESRLSLRKPKNSTKKEKTLKEYGNDFKEQMLIRLTHGEQLVIHEALLAYLYNRNLSELFETLSSILDKPYKIQLLHYLSYLLPQETLPSFEQYAIELMDKTIEAQKRESLKQQKQERQISKQKQKQNKQRKQKHSIVENTNNNSLESLLYQEDESFDILFETLKILGSPQEVRKQDVSGPNSKDQFIANDSLVSENDLKHIEKGSTLDLLLSMDRNKLQKLKKEVVANTTSNHTIANKTANKSKRRNKTAIVNKDINGNGIVSDSNYGNGYCSDNNYGNDYCDDLIHASRERFSRNSHQNGIIEEDDISQAVEPFKEIFTVPYATAHDEYIDRGPPNFVPTPPPSRRYTSVEPRNSSTTTPKSKRRNTFDNNVKHPIESIEHVKKEKMKKPARHSHLKEKSMNKIIDVKSINKVTEIKNLFDNQDLNNNKDNNNNNGPDNLHVNKQNGVDVIDCSNQNYIKNNETKINKSKPPPPIRKESLHFLNKNENIFDRNENENGIKNEIINIQDRTKEKEAINYNKEMDILHSSRPILSSNHKPLSDENIISEKNKQQFKPMDNEISIDNMLTSAISSTPIVPLLNFDNIIPTSESTIMFPTPPPLNDLHPLLHPTLVMSTPPPPPPLPNMVSPPPPPLPPMVGGELKVEMQLKRINWEKLSGARLENTVWGEMKPTEEMINFDELEELFTTKPSNNIVKKADTTKQSEGLLCSKKVHNLGILLGHLKLSIDEIFKAVINVDYTTLTDAHIQTMLTCAPDPNETAVFNEIPLSTENENEMSMADRFTMKMMSIPNYYERLKIMLYRSEFSEKMKELKPDITSVLNACKELRESQKLRHILEVVLTAGNYMNKGYNRVAGASGFKISFLPKLMSTKTSDNNSTLLHVIVNNFLKNKPEVLALVEELESIPNAAKVSSQMISQEITLLKQGMKELEDELFISRDNVLPNDKFAKVMSQFVSEAHHSFHELLTQYSQMQADFKQLVEFFGDEYTKTTTEDFFGSFAIFLQHIETTKEALLSSQNEFNQGYKRKVTWVPN